MTSQTEKMTGLIKTWVVIVSTTITICISVFAVYTAAVKGINDGFEQVYERINKIDKDYGLRIQALENSYAYQKDDLADLKRIVTTYREALKPDEDINPRQLSRKR